MTGAPGRFLTLEGPEGSGKTTQLAFLVEALQREQIPHLVTREPGGTPLGEELRRLLLQPETATMNWEAELLLMFAARAEHVSKRIQPALSAGQWVLCDRFTDATYAYQGGGRGVPFTTIQALEEWTLHGFKPDRTLLLDVPVALSLERIQARGALDRFEQEPLDFFERVRQAYLQRYSLEPERITYIQASSELDLVRAEILEVFTQELKDWRAKK